MIKTFVGKPCSWRILRQLRCRIKTDSRERQTESQRQREAETERHTETDRDGQTEIETQTDRHADGQKREMRNFTSRHWMFCLINLLCIVRYTRACLSKYFSVRFVKTSGRARREVMIINKDSSVDKRARLVIGRSQVRFSTEAARELSAPELTFCADSFSMPVPPPCYRSGT